MYNICNIYVNIYKYIYIYKSTSPELVLQKGFARFKINASCGVHLQKSSKI